MSAAHREAGVGRGGGDQLDDDLVADQRLAAPVLGDEGEQAVLDLVPFAGAGREVADGHGQAGLVGEALQLELPQPDARAVAAAAIGGDQQPARRRDSARCPMSLPPAADALDREGGGVVVDADADPALVGGDVVDAVGLGLAQAPGS